MQEHTQKSPQHEDIYNRLLDVIREYNAVSDRLPPEEVLAADLGISRVKLRDVLAALEANGYINRKKGAGTFINRCLLEEPARLDIGNIYEQTVAESGYRARTLIRRLQFLPQTPPEIAETLDTEPSAPVHLIEKVIFADERPAIYLQDYVPPKYYNQNNIDMRLLASSTFSFIQDYSKDAIESIVVHLDVCEAEGKVAREMELPAGTPVLCLHAVCHSFRSVPIACSVEYHNTKILPYCFHKRANRFRYYAPSGVNRAPETEDR